MKMIQIPIIVVHILPHINIHGNGWLSEIAEPIHTPCVSLVHVTTVHSYHAVYVGTDMVVVQSVPYHRYVS